MPTTARIVCTIYTVVLSAGLLTPQGGELAGKVGGFVWGLGDHPNLQHFLAFGVLAFLCGWAAWPVGVARIAISLVLYAVGTELLQGVIPGRSADVWDAWPICWDWLQVRSSGSVRGAGSREQGAGSGERGTVKRYVGETVPHEAWLTACVSWPVEPMGANTGLLPGICLQPVRRW